MRVTSNTGYAKREGEEAVQAQRETHPLCRRDAQGRSMCYRRIWSSARRRGRKKGVEGEEEEELEIVEAREGKMKFVVLVYQRSDTLSQTETPPPAAVRVVRFLYIYTVVHNWSMTV